MPPRLFLLCWNIWVPINILLFGITLRGVGVDEAKLSVMGPSTGADKNADREAEELLALEILNVI
jgi:hypothetical protein